MSRKAREILGRRDRNYLNIFKENDDVGVVKWCDKNMPKILKGRASEEVETDLDRLRKDGYTQTIGSHVFEIWSKGIGFRWNNVN